MNKNSNHFDSLVVKRAMSLTLIFLLVFLTTVSTKEIRSTKEGGNWCEPTTWVSGEIPGENDNVIIDGKVSVNCPAFADSVHVNVDCLISVNPNDSLQCHFLRLEEKDGKKGNINNMGKIIVFEKKAVEEKEEF
jgi:hypothetical protein